MPRFSAIYRGAVMHARYRPVQHRLEHRVFAMLLDLDELEELARATRGFGHNRFNFLSFYDRDHGPGDGTPLRPWLESLVAAQVIDIRGGALRVLCYPRVLGFVFNPLSVWYCYRRDGALAAVVYEVHNTFGERHAYVLPVAGSENAQIEQRAAKAFHVSPFLSMDCHYRFRVVPPGDAISVTIREWEGADETLVATFAGRRSAFTAKALWAAWAAHPLMTLKVVAAIHWHAFLLWRKGLAVQTHPARATPAPAVSETR